MSRIKVKNTVIIILGVVLLFALGFSILHIKGAQTDQTHELQKRNKGYIQKIE